MSPELDPFMPPHSAEELLGRVLARGHSLRRHQRNRRAAMTLGPASLVLLVIAGVAVALHGPKDTTTLVQTRPGAGGASSTSTSHAGLDGNPLAPPNLAAGGPGVTDPFVSSSSSSSSSTTVRGASGSRRAPIAAFDLRAADGRYQTAVLRPGAVQPEAITAPTTERQWPALSPDGTRVAFNSTERNLLEGVRSIFELYVVNSDGSGLRQITASPLDAGHGSRWPSWSPDGSHLVAGCASGTATAAICTLRPDGSDGRVIGPASAGYVMPRWSPDGTKVLVLQGSGAGSAIPWLLDAQGTQPPRRAVAGTVPMADGNPAVFSDDGSQLLFTQPLEGGLAGQLTSVDLRTGRSGRLAGLPPGSAFVGCGGRQVLYRTDAAFGPAAAGDLILVGLDASEPTVVLHGPSAGALTPTSCALR